MEKLNLDATIKNLLDTFKRRQGVPEEGGADEVCSWIAYEGEDESEGWTTIERVLAPALVACAPTITGDGQLNGYAHVYPDVNSMVQAGVAAAKRNNDNVRSRSFLGRDDIETLDDHISAWQRPWPEGIRVVEEMRKELENSLSAPKSMKRKGRWTADSFRGEIDVDRAMRGADEPYRETWREQRSGTRNIAILANIGGSCGVRPHDMFWRGAATVALIDMLEQAGYTCEVWLWTLINSLYRVRDRHKGFFAAKVKDAGDEVDQDSIAKCLSPWFFRGPTFGCFLEKMGKSGVHSNLGYHDSYMGEWRQYLDVTEGIRTIEVPITFDRESTIYAVQEILNELQAEAN